MDQHLINVFRIWVSYLLGENRFLGGLGQLLNCLGVMTKILLASDKNDGEPLAEVKDFGDPL